MDILKELESFKTVAIAKGWSIDGETTQTNYRFYSLTTNSGWEAWQAAKAQVVQEWISVADKEPDCGETVLICWSDSPEVEPEKDYMDIDIDTGALYWSNYNDGDEPSHWMPLPKVIELQEPANA